MLPSSADWYDRNSACWPPPVKGKSKSKPARSRASSRGRASRKRSGLPLDHPYRVLAETIGEGAALLDDAGTVLYANAPCAEILGVPPARLTGTLLRTTWPRRDRDTVADLLGKGLRGQVRTQLSLVLDNVRRRLVRLSFSRFAEAGPRKIAVVVTELTESTPETNTWRSKTQRGCAAAAFRAPFATAG